MPRIYGNSTVRWKIFRLALAYVISAGNVAVPSMNLGVASGMEIESSWDGWTQQYELERVKVAWKRNRGKEGEQCEEKEAKLSRKNSRSSARSAFPRSPTICSFFRGKKTTSAVCAVACTNSTHGPEMMMRYEKKWDFKLNKYVRQARRSRETMTKNEPMTRSESELNRLRIFYFYLLLSSR